MIFFLFLLKYKGLPVGSWWCLTPFLSCFWASWTLHARQQQWILKWLKTISSSFRVFSQSFNSQSLSTQQARGCTNCFGPKCSLLVYHTAQLGWQGRARTETTMVPVTCTKHFLINTASQTKRKRLEEQRHPRQGKEGEQVHHVSRKWNVYNCNFKLFFLRFSNLKSRPCRSANLILCQSSCAHDRILV